jgi:hypothetical protein
MTRALAAAAARARRFFDAVPVRIGSVTVVGALAALTAATAALQVRMLSSGCDAAVDMARLEVTFSTSRFVELLGAQAPCRAGAIRSFLTWDMLFPLCYGALLCAVYLWAERWRRFDIHDRPTTFAPSARRDAVVIAPLVAALLDVVFENPPLWYAARAVAANPSAAGSLVVAAAVNAGSLAALAKWVLVLFSIIGIACELVAGPRGLVLWRVRFSVLAVALGGVPLLAVPQGQDILQRLFEGEHPAISLSTAALAPTLTALAVWYCARKLMELRLDPPARGADSEWYEFFGEQLPRVLGIALLALAGTAFARAGLAPVRFIGVGFAAFFAALLTRRLAPRAFGVVGSRLLPPRWRSIDGLPDRVGRMMLAAGLGVLVFRPQWWPWEHPCGDIPCLFDEGEQILEYLRIAAYACLMAAWIFQLFVRFRRARQSSRLSARPAIDTVDAHAVGGGVKTGVLIGALVSLGFLLAFTFVPVTLGRTIGPLWILSLAAANAVFFGSVAVWIGKRYRLPFVTTALLLAVLFSLWNDNHVMQTLPDGAAAIAARPTIEQQLDRWLVDVPRSGGKVPVVLVAGAGGGLRAAYWTAIALASLQDRAGSFARHLFAFSGVSGGSLGGALFAALVRDIPANPPPPCAATPSNEGPFSTCVHQFMRGDFLSPVLAKLIAPDLLQWFLPVGIRAFDRSLGLERSWQDSYRDTTGRDTFGEGFTALTADAAIAARVPTLMLNATHVESGRRYVMTSMVADAADHRLQDAGDVFDIIQRDIPLATAVHNSARFTYVSPAGHLDAGDGVERGRIVDGGYFENSGLTTLREVYDVVVRRPDVDVFVLYLCNDPQNCFRETAGSPGGVKSSAADELLSPVRALLNTRDARGSLARANLQRVAGANFFQLNVCGDLPAPARRQVAPTDPEPDSARLQRARDRVVSPPLGWLLSKLARDWMDAALRGVDPDANGNCYERNAFTLTRLQEILKGPAAAGQ